MTKDKITYVRTHSWKVSVIFARFKKIKELSTNFSAKCRLSSTKKIHHVGVTVIRANGRANGRANASKKVFAFRKLLSKLLQTRSQIAGNLTGIRTRYLWNRNL